MASKSFFMLFVAAQIMLVVLHIYKHSKKIDLLYAAQKNQIHKERMLVRRQALLQQLALCTNQAEIMTFAQQELQMKPLHISQVKRCKEQDADNI